MFFLVFFLFVFCYYIFSIVFFSFLLLLCLLFCCHVFLFICFAVVFLFVFVHLFVFAVMHSVLFSCFCFFCCCVFLLVFVHLFLLLCIVCFAVLFLFVLLLCIFVCFCSSVFAVVYSLFFVCFLLSGFWSVVVFLVLLHGYTSGTQDTLNVLRKKKHKGKVICLVKLSILVMETSGGGVWKCTICRLEKIRPRINTLVIMPPAVSVQAGKGRFDGSWASSSFGTQFILSLCAFVCG